MKAIRKQRQIIIYFFTQAMILFSYIANGTSRLCNVSFGGMKIKNEKIVRQSYRSMAFATALSSNAAVRATVCSLNFPLNDSSLLPLNTESLSPDKTFSVYNPAAPSKTHSSSIIATIPKIIQNKGGGENISDFVKEAIQRSHEAQLAWRNTTASHRGSLLRKWSDLIKQHSDDLVTIMTKESGKTFSESRGEVIYGASFVDYFSSAAMVSTNNAGGGVVIPTPFVKSDGMSPRGMAIAMKEPVGVAAMITPWNFPLAMITRKAAPALAAGCTAIVKPSELTPLTAIAVQTLALRAGIPEGVLQLVISHDRHSSSEVGSTFCTHELVKKISFTGSTKVGKILLEQASSTVKRMSMELGGNAPFIIFHDADIDIAVTAAMKSKFRGAGQTCVCADRFLVHSSIEEKFVDKLVEAVESIVVGDGTLETTTMGPLITSDAANSVYQKVQEAIQNGAECVVGGSRIQNLGDNFFEPTVLVNVKPGRDSIWDTETFGPVAAITTFHTDEEAIRMANDCSVGLASYICSGDVGRALSVASR